MSVPATGSTLTFQSPLRSSIARATSAPLKPLVLVRFDHLEYELRTHSAATPETTAPSIITKK